MGTRGPGYTRERLTAAAVGATSHVDLLRRLGQPLESGPLRYLRTRLSHYGIDTSHFHDEPLPERPRRAFSERQLREAAARSSSLREVMERLGVVPYGGAYSFFKRRLAHYGIDVSHFRPPRGDRPPLLEADAVREAVAGSRSIAQVLRQLGLPDTGASRRAVQRALLAHGVRTDHFSGKAHYRGRRSPERKEAHEVLRVLPSGAPRAKRGQLHRALQDFGVPYVCAECGTGSRWRGRPLTLHIDHVNGDRLDNRRTNLRYLCPSCHSQTPTYARRSRGATGSRDRPTE
ncbi:HNH endonuclease signature motif containing protein [Streptomyces sp. TRM70308]|uniref:HNH endonuclease signature motif containing protein n=1 Tax=Streptomyces sp. TRM70308 TaxID=3131932 RepID=UPI003D07CCCE